MNYTLTYSPSSEGWPSFYSFFPDFLGYMNQFLYTWKGGNLYRHNSFDVNRNTFYGQFSDSTINGVFNERPIEKKVFKTIALESTHPWEFECSTDLEDGNINKTFFELKEGTYFSYIRGIQSVPAILSDYDLRSAQGLGTVQSVNTAVLTAVILQFSFKIDRITSVGDLVYAGDTPALAGTITSIDRVNNRITINTTGATPPTGGQFIIVMKNNVAESNGVRGDYMEYRITSNETSASEIFAIKSQVFKSFP